jgi:hypothetical protein
VWRGLGDWNSSDKEWEQSFWRLEQERPEPLDQQIDMRGMIDDTFQQCDDHDSVEDRLQEAMVDAFAVVDNIHKESWSFDNWNEPCFAVHRAEEVPEDGNDVEDGDIKNFDPHSLEDAIHGLYANAKPSKLVATILLLNLCIVHGVCNCFVAELFSILHGHILLKGNS